MASTGWCCFKFWFCWRLVMALLAHFNWYTAYARINCFYFTAWKSYDMLWFWAHLALCICFKPLRRGNYLLVFVNLLWGKRKYPQRSFEQIYDHLYNQHKYTKSERVLRSLEATERGDGTTAGGRSDGRPTDPSNEANNKGSSSDSEDEEPDQPSPDSQQLYPPLTVAKEKNEEDVEAAMPRLNVNRASNSPSTARDEANPEGQSLLPVSATDTSPDKELTPSIASASSRSTATRLVSKLPLGFLRHTGISAVSADGDEDAETRLNKEQKEAKIATAKEEKRREKQRRHAERAARKAVNAQRKAELRRLAKIERRRRNLSDAIDLLLTWLRLGASFAIMLGNFHKAVLPKFMKAPNEYVADTPDVLMIFMIAMMVDILLFWLSMFWTYMQQCRLCCRLGPCRFWLWLIALGFFGGVCMFLPMHYVHQQLDPTWCVFRPGTALSEYMDG